MAHTTTKVNGNVILVEPNIMNGNENQTNTVPQYQDMYIFAELKATRKGRTVIINNKVSDEFSADFGTVNFIGNNQDNSADNPNYLNFTTNYYDGSVGNKTQYEGFGITNIKMQINSSYIPKVRIQFVDIRGLAFFNQDDSPYRMLFDFPPPIFQLTVKGYYGKSLTYRLHLVKYTSEFNSGDGNFTIDAEFVGLTFAPLTDILFKYILNTPLIELGGDMSSEPNQPPQSTYELILKLQSVYAEIGKMLDSEEESTELREVESDLEKIDAIDSIIQNYKENEVLSNVGTPYLARRTPQKPTNFVEIPRADNDENDYLVEIRNIREFNSEIIKQQSSDDKSNKTERLFIAYAVSSNLENTPEVPPYPDPLTASTNILDNVWEFPSANQAAYFLALNKYRERLLGQSLISTEITEDDIDSPKEFILNTNLKTQEETRTKYYGMELTDFYYEIYKQKGKLLKRKEVLAQELADKINASIAENLGMLPSVYNVMEIILNDVDRFFKILKKTAVNAHQSHNLDENKNLIVNNGAYGEKTNTTTVYPFPLIINRKGDTEERVAPIKLSETIEFPELNLVEDFINTFLQQENWEEQLNLRNEQDDDGLNYWIPLMPIDSVLGGSNPTSPYLGINDDVRNGILRILLQRYYAFSQGTLPYTIYPSFVNAPRNNQKKKLDKISKAYAKMYGIAEAININQTLTTKKAADAIEIMCNRYNTNIQNFYDDIGNLTVNYETSSGNKLGSLYSFPRYDPINFPVTPSDNASARVYTDKNNPDFVGLTITTEPIAINDNDDDQNKLNEFLRNSNLAGTRAAIKRGTYEFTTDNIPYLPDTYNEKDFFGGRNEDKGLATINSNEGGKTGLYTRFLNEYAYDGYYGTTTYRADGFEDWDDINIYYPNSQSTAYNQGHASFGDISDDRRDRYMFSMGNNIVDVWTQTLAHNDNDVKLYPYLTNNNRLSTVLFLSNFGNTLSPFTQFPNNLRDNFFDIPSVIDAPRYVGAYMGALLDAIDEGWEDDILDFFTGTTVSQNIDLPNKGYYVLADLHDVREYLSENDKEIFRAEYSNFLQNFETFQTDFKRLYNLANQITDKTKDKRYKYFLDPNVDTEKVFNTYEKGQYSTLMDKLVFRKSIVIYSEKTFNRIPLSDYSPGYVSLFEIINNIDYGDSYYKPTTDTYFQTLFNRLAASIGETKDDLRQEEIKLNKIKGDEDVINQLYYSFKNINDKWLSGTGQAKSNYPLISGNDTRLIDRFAFVDRAMNPIGETMINAEMLIDLADNDDASVFTVISSLLSANGFIFFPLQNFLSFADDNSWEESFKIQTGSISDQEETYFVAMYIGGTSSYPSIKTNGFEEDGIIDISEPGVADFKKSTGNTEQFEENRNQLASKDKFPWSQVRAFRVRFGEQNQSMFEDIKIDSKEYNDTNESIQILSRLAGDNKESQPTPKGQNLYNMYENRSYKASVTGFGNAMIQPTQYFQLENIPMFNGAYIILDVEHDISPNKMRTTFSGTKILKYPVPRVTNAIAFRDFSDVSAGEAARRASESQNVSIPQATMMTPERLTQLNSVYGIDVSHWNGDIDWKLAKKNSVPIDFAYMKISQGNSLDSFQYSRYNFDKNLREAKANNVKIGVYHFAVFGRTTNPYNDANADADHFLDTVARMPNPPDLPVVLDIEMDCFTQVSTYKWNNRDEDVKTYIERWVQRVKDAGYEVMIYTAPQYLKNVSTDYLSSYPLWYGRPTNVNGSMNPEIWEPTTPINSWNNWTIWQFSFRGNVSGVNGEVDLNAMRKSFFDKY